MRHEVSAITKPDVRLARDLGKIVSGVSRDDYHSAAINLVENDLTSNMHCVQCLSDVTIRDNEEVRDQNKATTPDRKNVDGLLAETTSTCMIRAF